MIFVLNQPRFATEVNGGIILTNASVVCMTETNDVQSFDCSGRISAKAAVSRTQQINYVYY